jgi:hypothetical protein
VIGSREREAEALRRILRRASWNVLLALALIGAVVYVAASLAFEWFGWGLWVHVVMLLNPLAVMAAVQLVVGRALRVARRLPRADALTVTEAMARHPNARTRRLSVQVLERLRPAGTEVVPAAPPGGRGNEVAAGDER